VPLAIDEVCLRALRLRPDERYPTAAAFADALEQAVAQSPGVAIASSRAVASLVKELGLQAQPEQLSGPAIPPPSGPSSGSVPRSVPAPHSHPTPIGQQLPLSQSRPLSYPTQLSQAPSAALSSPLSEPASATGIGAVVSDPGLQRPNVRRSMFAGVAVATLSLTAGALVAVGEYELSQHEGKVAASASSTAASGGSAAAAPAPPARVEAPSANDTEGGDPSTADPGASARASTSEWHGAPSVRTGRTPARTTTSRGTQPESSESARDSAPPPRVTPPTPFRPTEL
jgi:serine/threonine-protein kinase